MFVGYMNALPGASQTYRNSWADLVHEATPQPHAVAEWGLWQYNVRATVWKELAQFEERRTLFATTVLEGCIYVLGGEDGARQRLNSAMCYNHRDAGAAYNIYMFSQDTHIKRRVAR